MPDTLLISELAERTGFRASALRYYERVGLLAATERSPGGYRLYDLEAVERLRFIERVKQLGLALDEIRSLVPVWDSGRCAHVQASLRTQIMGKSVEVHHRIDELTTFSARLDRALNDLAGPAADGPCEAGCGCADTRPRDDTRVPEPVRPGRVRSMTATPVGCTLAVGDQPSRLAEWESVLSAVIDREPVEGGIRLSFPTDPNLAGMLASLALREQACCSFFTFTLRSTAGSLSMDVVAPPAVQGIVNDLFGGDGRLNRVM